MSELRPSAPAPIFRAIPAELQARRQWVVWHYELDAKGKWTKVPYNPRTTRKAASTRPSSWASFHEAKAAYLANPVAWAGIGYMFSADDPYVGGDIDHCITDGMLNKDASVLLPLTYAEVSPSGAGIKFIARATGDYGRKTKRGELYSSKRFFTITGNVLPGHEAITGCQAAIEAFAAVLSTSTSTKAITSGKASGGSRAELVKTIPESEWQAARQLALTQSDKLMRRLRAAAREGTQLDLLLAGDYASFHKKWLFVELYRADGSLDASMVRAVAANGIKTRGFTFPEYVMLMSQLYAAQALTKWGTKQAWREELVALWHKAPEPKRVFTPGASYLVPIKKPRVDDVIENPRGRGRPSHAPEVERFYLFLREHITSDAAVKIGDLADVYGIHRRTVSTYLNELRAENRIATRRLARGRGVIIAFDDMIEIAASESSVSPTTTPEIDAAPAPHEETRDSVCVSSVAAEADRISGDPIEPPAAPKRPTPAPLSLETLVREFFDAYPDVRPSRRQVGVYVMANAGRLVDTAINRVPLAGVMSTGKPRQRERFVNGPLEAIYTQALKRRRYARQDAQEAAKARKLPWRQLQQKARSLATQAASIYALLRTGQKLPDVLNYELDGKVYKTKVPCVLTLGYAGQLKHRAGIYAAEEQRRIDAGETPDLLAGRGATVEEVLTLAEIEPLRRVMNAKAAKRARSQRTMHTHENKSSLPQLDLSIPIVPAVPIEQAAALPSAASLITALKARKLQEARI